MYLQFQCLNREITKKIIIFLNKKKDYKKRVKLKRTLLKNKNKNKKRKRKK